MKNSHPPAVSVVTFSADVATLYREQKDPEKMENLEELSADFDENSGFAIIINGHSLSYCLSPELEMRFEFIWLILILLLCFKLHCSAVQIYRSCIAMQGCDLLSSDTITKGSRG